MRPLNQVDDTMLQGANSVVYKCRVVYVAREGGKQVEWEGPDVVLKAIITSSAISTGPQTLDAVHKTMLRQQAADHEVLSGLPPHPNIVEVVHFFEAPAMLLRPFVADVRLPYTSVSKTT